MANKIIKSGTLPSKCYVPVLSMERGRYVVMAGVVCLMTRHVLRRVPRHRLMMHVRVMHHLHVTLVHINKFTNRHDK